MPKINVYLSEDLAEAVKAADLPVSAICQRALADALDDANISNPSRSGLLGRLMRAGVLAVTGKASTAIQHADDASKHPTSIDLFTGIIAEGDNLGLVIMGSSGVEIAAVATLLAAIEAGDADSAATVLDRAVEEAVSLGHNYIGCEHVLLGLLAGDEGDPVANALRSRGMTLETTRVATRIAVAAMRYEKSRSATNTLPSSVRTVLEEVRDEMTRIGIRVTRG